MRYALFLLLAVGCSSQPARLRVVKVDVVEGGVPLVLVMRVTNEGGRTAYVESADLSSMRKFVIDPQDSLSGVPQFLDCVPMFGDRDRVKVAPGATEEIRFALAWDVGEGQVQAIAIVNTRVTINRNQATSPPVSLVLQSYPGQLDIAINREPNPEQDELFLKLMREFDGDRSDGFTRLLESLEAKVGTN